MVGGGDELTVDVPFRCRVEDESFFHATRALLPIGSTPHCSRLPACQPGLHGCGASAGSAAAIAIAIARLTRDGGGRAALSPAKPPI